MKTWISILKKGGILAVFLLCIAVSPAFGADVAENDSVYSGELQADPEFPVITITPTAAELLTGDTRQFTAVVSNASCSEIPDMEFSWESSDELVGTVDAGGLFTALAEGAVTITAVSGNVSGTCDVTVTETTPTEPVPPEDIPDEELLSEAALVELSPGDVDLFVNDTQLFSAAAYDAFGAEIPDAEFTWECSDELVGTVNESGLFTAISEGTVTVCAISGDTWDECFVTVSGAEVPEITPDITPEPTQGSIAEVLTTALAFDGGVIPAVDDVYILVANNNGTRFDDFGNDTFHIIWSGGGLNALSISSPGGSSLIETNATSGTFYVNENGGRGYHDAIYLCIAVNETLPDDFRIHILADGYQWTPSEMPHTAPAEDAIEYVNPTIDEWFDKDDFIYGPQNWKPAAQQKFPIYPNQDMSETSNTFRLMFVDLYGGILTAHPLKVQYDIENLTSMAAFSAYGYTQKEGLPTGNGPIDYYVTSWVTNVGTGVYVTAPKLSPAASVTITPSSADVPLNGKITLDATAFDDLGEKIYGASFNWASSDIGIGTVNEDGVFTPVSIGETNVTATCGNATGSAQITVVSAVPLFLDSVNVYPSELTFFVDEVDTTQLTVEGFDQFGDPYPEAVYSWSSSNTSVGTVDQSGLFSVVSSGQTTVTAESGGVSGSAIITIRERPDWSLAMSGVSDICVNRTDFIGIANANPLSYTDNRNNLWSGTGLKTLLGLVDDDDPSVFNTTKAESGYIVTVRGSEESSFAQFESAELLADGVDYIVANKLSGMEIPDYAVDGRIYWPLYLHSTSSSGDSRVVEQVSSIELSLPVDNVTSVSLVPADAKVWSDGTLQLTAEAYNETGALIEDVSFLWSSSNSGVGTVDPNGLFTAVSAGETVVTASVSGLSAQTNVTVFSSDDDPRVWHVEKDGSGDFTTITEAIAFARNDDTVMVGDGEWSEGISISQHLNLTSRNGPSKTTLTSSVFITGYNGKVSGFTFASGTITLSAAHYCEISGNIFEIPGCYCGIKLSKSSEYVTICDNYINQSNYGIDSTESSNCYISNNTIRVTEPGIKMSWCTGFTISDNDIEASGSQGRGIEIVDGSGHQILNNTISGQQFGVYFYMSSGTPVSLMTGNAVSGQFYLFQVTGYFPCYLNDFTGSELRLRNCAPSFGLPFPVTYEYDGGVRTGAIGNYYSAYNCTDANGDGIGDEPKSVGGVVIDRYPLIRPSDNYTVTGTIPVISNITVSPESSSLNLTESQQFSAVVCDADGAEIPGAIITWAVSDPTIGSINQTGYFTAAIGDGGGTTTVYATSGGVRGTATVDVLRPTPVLTYITVEPAELDTIPGSSHQFTATGFDTYDLAIDDLIFTWTSSNGAVGSVDDTGNFTALSVGTTVITATNDTISGSAPVSVFSPVIAENVTLSPGYVYLNPDGVQQFTATAYNGAGFVLAGPVVTWTSSNPAVGTVNASGFFAASSAGETTVSAQVNDTIASSAVYVVADPGTPRTFYVDDDGTGDVPTIGDAVAIAHPADTIIVRKGNYSENIVADRRVTILSESGPEDMFVTPTDAASPIITLAGNESVIRGLAFYSGAPAIAMSGIEGCTIEGNFFSGGTCGINMQNSQNNNIRNNSFDTVADIAASYGVYLRDVASEDVSGNVFASCRYGICVYDSSQGSNNVTIQNNSLTDCYYGLYLRGTSGSRMHDNEISDNTVINTGYSIYLRYADNNLIIGNRIQEGNSRTIYLRYTDGNTLLLNAVSDCTGSFYVRNSVDNWNSTEMITYRNNGSTYTGYLGNYWDTCVGTDANDDGVFDEPLSLADGATDYYPLVAPFVNGIIREPIALTTIVLDPTEVSLEKGYKTAFTATAFDQYGDEMSVTPFEWASSDATIGTVNANGIFTAHGVGTATISASHDNVTGTATVTVTMPQGDQTRNSPLDFPGWTITVRGDGTREVSVNLTATGATVAGNFIRIDEDTFTLIFETEDAPTVGNGTANGTVAGILLNTAPVSSHFANCGNATASLGANLTGIPSGAGLEVTISENISETARSVFQIAANTDGLNLDAVAYAMNVVKTNLTNGDDITDATIRMGVSPAWVAANGGYDGIRIIRFGEDATREVLDTVYLGFDGELDQFEAYSPNGLSIFGLSATSAAAGSTGSGSYSSGSGSSSSVSTARCDGICAGETGVFLLDMTAITEVDVKAGIDIPSMMLTAEEASAPSDIGGAPPEVYQYIRITSYLAPEDSMEMATLKFSVDREWLDSIGSSPSDVKMYHYNEATETWDILSTVSCGEDGTCYIFFADTPSFSLFAISAEPGSAPSASVSSDDGVQPAAQSGDIPAAGEQAPAETQAPAATTGNTTAIVIVGVFVILAICGGVYWQKKNGKE